MDIWKQTVQKDIEDLKKCDKELDEKIKKLERITDFHERDIRDIKEDLKEIKEDTKWMRRTITNAVIIATAGGLIGLIFYALKMQGGL